MELSDIRYISSGKFISSGRWIHPQRTIDSYEIIFVLNGSFSLHEEHTVYNLKKDSVLLLDKGMSHGGEQYTDEQISFFWVHFSDMPEDLSLPKHFTSSNPSMLTVLFKQLLHFSNSKQYGTNTAGFALNLLLSEISTQYLTQSGPKLALVNNICEYVRINSDRKITVEEISEKFQYNKDYLSRLLKKHGVPGLKELIVKGKTDKARYLLLNTDLPIKEISNSLGFECDNDFLKFFKYHENISPSELRNIYSQTHINKK